MKGIKHIILSGLCLLPLACSVQNPEPERQMGTLSLTSSVLPFEGDVETRTTIAGNAFAVGDRMKLKIICPYSDHTEYGETTYGHTADGMWIMKWNGSGWTKIVRADKVDVEGQYTYSDARDLFYEYEAQQTPYVYTASTWTENIRFHSRNKYYSQYSYVFHADQSEQQNYLRSDLLWAQTIMQTGSYNVHLSFRHKMACLRITLAGGVVSAGDAVLTLEGMPDIDQCELVVGDYYAAKGKSSVDSGYGYKQKCSCSQANNGKVMGVAVIDDTAGKAIVYPMTGNPNPASRATIPNTGVYTAYYDSGTGAYYLIVPPCVLSSEAKFWIRDGENRYSYQLQNTTFEEGKLYPVTITIAAS